MYAAAAATAATAHSLNCLRCCAQWDKAQEARVKCAHAWANAGNLAHDAKVALLKQYLVMLFHTVMPPEYAICTTLRHHASQQFMYLCGSRVGIIRKLRWGVTLKLDAPGAYRLDMTKARFSALANARAHCRRSRLVLLRRKLALLRAKRHLHLQHDCTDTRRVPQAHRL